MRGSVKNTLKTYRVMAEMTQETLALRVGVSRQTINAIEQGKYLPSLELALKLGKVFKVPIETLFTFEEAS